MSDNLGRFIEGDVLRLKDRWKHTLHLGKYPQVKKLVCSECGWLREITGLENLTELEELNVSWTAIKTLDVSHLTRLKKLDCYRCEALTEIVGLEKLTSLEELNVLRTAIEVLDIRSLAGLRELQCWGCEALKKVVSLKKQTALEELKVFRTAIVTLDVSGLTGLKYLDCYGCEALTEIVGLENLVVLEALDISLTAFHRIPECIRGMKQLKTLALSELELEELPDWLPELGLPFTREKYGDGIRLYMTTVEGVDMSIFDQSQETILEWFKYRKQGKPLNEIKVIFLGQGIVGKSWTIARLMRDGNHPEPGDVPRLATPGIQIKSKDYKLKDGREVLVRFWDFGGQEVMHSMHRMFLTERTFYVVMVNVRTGDHHNDARTWLSSIKAFAEGAPVLLVLNWIDGGPYASVDETELKALYPQLKGIVEMSALEYDQEQFNRVFTERLLDEISKIETLSTPFIEAWNKVMLRVRDMRTQEQKNYITGKDFKRYCDECGVTTEEKVREDLLKWFSDLGVGFAYQERKPTKDWVILNPEWLTNAIYIILNNRREEVQNGVVPRSTIADLLDPPEELEKEIYAILPGESYESHEIDHVLMVIRKFGLSFPLGEDREFFPALCNRTTLPIAEEYEKAPDTLELRAVYDYLPDNLMQTLMVELNRDLELENVWKTGAQFIHPITKLSAVVKTEGETKLRILVRGQGKTHDATSYLNYLWDNVKRITSRMNITASEEQIAYRHPDDGAAEYYDYVFLVGSQEKGVDMVYSKLKKEMIPIQNILTQSDNGVVGARKKLIQDIVVGCVHLQGDKNRPTSEVPRNTRLRDVLRIMGYFGSDESLSGSSPGGKRPGSLDMDIRLKSSTPWTIFEGMNHRDKGYWLSHLQKLMIDYNPMRLPFLILVVYVDCARGSFSGIVEKYRQYTKDDDLEGFTLLPDPKDMNFGMEYHEAPGGIRGLKCVYAHDGATTTVYQIFVQFDK